MKLKWMLMTLLFAGMLFAEQYEDRWFYVSRLLNNDQELADVEELVRTAGKVKLNGMLFACGVEGYATWIPERKVRLAKLKKACDENGVEIIPIIWSIGYGTMLAHNPNYVEGLLTKDMPYVVKGNKAYVLEEKGARAANVDFEKHDGNVFAIKGWTDAAGQRSFADTEVKHGGECSVRLENFDSDKHGHGRICIEVQLKPNRRYRMKLFAKTEGLVPNKKAFKLQFYRMDGSQVGAIEPDIEPTQDWKEYSFTFFSGDSTAGRIYAGMWGGKQGKLWIDDITLETDGVAGVSDV
ncbi:MAG: carbohydrate binding domain-containing protein, partial [Victivallales bacterium]|nr:carbohydrate binding domain-containing protein [Victivallales bacterium]